MATLNSIPTGMQLPVLIDIFAEIAGMSNDPETLMSNAKCIYSCIPPGMQMTVLMAIATQILTTGISGVTGVYYGTTALRNATTPPGNAALWILSDSDPVNLVSIWNGVTWI